MQFARQRADQLAQSPLDRRMDVLVGLGKGEGFAFEFRFNSFQPGEDAAGFVFSQDSGLG